LAAPPAGKAGLLQETEPEANFGLIWHKRGRLPALASGEAGDRQAYARKG